MPAFRNILHLNFLFFQQTHYSVICCIVNNVKLVRCANVRFLKIWSSFQCPFPCKSNIQRHWNASFYKNKLVLVLNSPGQMLSSMLVKWVYFDILSKSSCNLPFIALIKGQEWPSLPTLILCKECCHICVALYGTNQQYSSYASICVNTCTTMDQ